MSAGSLTALGLALAVQAHPAGVAARQAAVAPFTAAAPIVPVRWVGGGRVWAGHGWGWHGGWGWRGGWGWHGGCCWGPGWGGWGWGLGVGFGWGWPAPWPVAVPYAPPAPQPPAAAAPRSFIVYFDWDRADLTQAARQIISQAAQQAQQSGAHVQVTGHTDLSGSSQYNQMLAARRANAVAAELARDGVRQDAIGVESFGKTRPAVPTQDGLREPHNRDVEIDLN
jgi:hypothetical protein